MDSYGVGVIMIHDFSPHVATTMYVDINSCFATIEQQARPQFRGKPLAVAAYSGRNGCILAASREAKLLGIKTGMRVGEAKTLCPILCVTVPDPEKYRFVNHALTKLLRAYTPNVSVQSIDEMIVRMDQTPYLMGIKPEHIVSAMLDLGCDIKRRIAAEIGTWITVSIGIAPNAFLAKTASNLEKPNGLQAITKDNVRNVLKTLALTDLCGIKKGNATRLMVSNITTPLAMYEASMQQLEYAFRSVIGRNWWMWLHGYEIGSLYAFHSEKQKSYGQSCALSMHTLPNDRATAQIVYQLVAKMGFRLRCDRFQAQGISVGCQFMDGTGWQSRKKFAQAVFATEDMTNAIMQLIKDAPQKPIYTVFVGVYDLQSIGIRQLSFDEREMKKDARTQAIDGLLARFGQDTVFSGMTLQANQTLVDRIAFGKSGINH